jgi:hypothetical protein
VVWRVVIGEVRRELVELARDLPRASQLCGRDGGWQGKCCYVGSERLRGRVCISGLCIEAGGDVEVKVK